MRRRCFLRCGDADRAARGRVLDALARCGGLRAGVVSRDCDTPVVVEFVGTLAEAVSAGKVDAGLVVVSALEVVEVVEVVVVSVVAVVDGGAVLVVVVSVVSVVVGGAWARAAVATPVPKRTRAARLASSFLAVTGSDYRCVRVRLWTPSRSADLTPAARPPRAGRRSASCRPDRAPRTSAGPGRPSARSPRRRRPRRPEARCARLPRRAYRG